ncbi:hypothetical protein GCM10027093_44940 [Paraburkholderia jirisanensis]
MQLSGAAGAAAAAPHSEMLSAVASTHREDRVIFILQRLDIFEMRKIVPVRRRTGAS